MSKKKKSKPASEPVDRVVEIEQLAALNPIDYEATRVQAAMRLKVRASILDREVTKKRRALGFDTDNSDDGGNGRAVKIVDPLPWPEPVDGDRVATTLAAAVKTYLVVSAAAADAIALWVLHTWCVGAFTMSPRLAVTEGRNLRIDYRWGVGDLEHHRKNAAELVALAPDVILTHGSTIMAPLHRATRTVPIVFVSVADPVAGGFVASLAKPGGNATGFTSIDYGMSGKWLELLKLVAPQITRVGVIRDPDQVSGGGQLGAVQAVASLLGVGFNALGVHDAGEIEGAITAFAREPNGGLVVTTSALAQIHRDLIIALAAKYRLPAIYPYRLFVTSGGLMCYTPQIVEQYRSAASYVDRILKGEKPADLPVQQPSKYDLVINLKTARALGLTVPPSLLARADEVIE